MSVVAVLTASTGETDAAIHTGFRIDNCTANPMTTAVINANFTVFDQYQPFHLLLGNTDNTQPPIFFCLSRDGYVKQAIHNCGTGNDNQYTDYHNHTALLDVLLNDR